MNRCLPILLFILLFSQSMVFAQPTNDNLCDALAIEIGATCTDVPNIDNTTATAETNEPEVPCAEGTPVVSNSVWYSFVAGANPVYILATPDDPDVGFQMNLFTLDGDCMSLDALTLLDCNRTATALLTSPSIVATLTEGTTYYVQISGRFIDRLEPVPSAGTGCITITEITPPVNDDACNATSITLDAGAQVFSNLGATVQENEASITPPMAPFLSPSPGWADIPLIDHSVWFTFTTPTEGANVVIDLEGSVDLAGSFNSQFALYEVGDCADFSSYTLLSAADNGLLSDPSGIGSLIVHPKTTAFCLPGDRTYYILVDGGSTFFFQPITNQGEFSLDLSTLEDTPITLQSVISGPDCAGGNEGSIAIGVTGGAGGYAYAWSTGDSIPNLIGTLTAGTYTLTVTDQCGVELVETFEVPTTANGPITLTNSDQTICAAGPITLTPVPTGGIGFGTKNLFYQNFVDFQTISFNSTFIQQPSIVDTIGITIICLFYTSPSPRDQRGSRMPSSA